MPALPRETFYDRLDALSGADLRDLIADLWTARGFDTHADGSAVVVVADADGERTLVPVVSRRFRGPSRPPSGVDPDVIVDGGGDGRPVAGEYDAAYVGPDDLYDRLLYGLDREVAERLLDRHLGVSATVDPSARGGVDGGGADGAGRVESVDGDGGADGRIAGLVPDGGDLTVATVLGAVVLAAVAAGLGPGVLLDAGGGDPGAAPEPTTGTATPTGTSGTPPGDAGALGATPAYPPGLSADGVDAAALRAAHEEYLSDRSYRVVERSRLPPELADVEWPTRHSVRRVGAGDRYRVLSTGRRTTDGSDARFEVDVYGLEGRRYFRVDAPGEPVEYRLERGSRSGLPEVTWAIEYHLSGGNATVETVRTNAGERYRVVVREPPADWSDDHRADVSDYRARATVHPAGYVIDVSVSYEVSRNGTTGTRSTRFRYDRIGNTTVTEPPWLDEARANVSNATTTRTPSPGPGSSTATGSTETGGASA